MDLALYSLPFLWQGILITLGISALVTALSLVLGVMLGTLSCYGPLPVRWAIQLLYCDVIRGLPVLRFPIYSGLPLLLGFEINSFVTAVVALTVFTTAQVTEIARGAMQSIH